MPRFLLIATAAAGFLAFGPAPVRAQRVFETQIRSSEPRLVAVSSLQSNLTRLVQQDAANALSTVAASVPASSSGLVTTLAPFVVEGRKSPQISSPRETRTQEFFRTGTLAQRVGPKLTSQLWMRGDQGLMLSFRW